ncbi:nadph-cytochrome p450 reductase [Diplodia corticola]|uniref:Bifunctional cytochrome P450/NADPH--P450 reductase n=1 Tax=Diplodia corticola TaxID=236234 RepID=A0A1J9QSZ5_9PEZI|nr:nadph-cytochrome p450 reductase [Diplodia corticola]OJD32086.1 nadph-cytochrome p450 reductase [Diplodia corticola]
MTPEPIPQPPTHLFGMLANLPEIDPSFPLSSFWRLNALYGPIFQLDMITNKVIVLSNYELAHETMDDEKFEKVITAGLKELRPLIKDGLFSAYPHETAKLVEGAPNSHAHIWSDGCSEDVPRTTRHRLAVDFALAFDTIGICGFNYRFNNFYAEHMHPFATQMAAALIESGKRANRTQMETRLRIWSNKQLQDNIHEMHKLCDDLVAQRKAHPQPDVNDLLNTMLNVADPVTGEKLDDENIRYNMVTFLIAGHETTSGTLSYTFYNLLKNPEKLHKAQQEVDSVLGDEPITVKHLDKFKYIDACLKETLRLNGPIGMISRRAKHDTVIGGRYKIPADHALLINLRPYHSDPAVWGEDAAEFKPERMFHMDKLPKDAWKPFGIGMRSCIGRAFAEQEMIINIALILQRFQVEMADPSYTLVNKSTLTIKPDGFFLKVRRRPGKSPMVGLASLATSNASKTTQDASHGSVPASFPKKKMTILYGSNAGTCKAFSEELQTNAPGFGFEAEVLTLDQATENIPKEQPVVIITSSYEGKPPENAAKFCSWLKDCSPSLTGVQYTVFGVGNSEWVSTYQRVPKLIDEHMSKNGARRTVDPWWADVKQDCTNDWENWTEKLWKSLNAEDGGAGGQTHMPSLRAEVIKHDMPVILGGKEMSWAVVRSSRSLGGEEVGLEKRELEIELPHETHYEAGDYFVVLPSNPHSTVARALSRFGLHPDDLISISDTRKMYLQSKEPIGAEMFFSHRVELNAPPTQRQLAIIIAATESEDERRSLESLASDANYRTKVVLKNYSILDILDDHPSVSLSLPSYIDMLKPLSPRQYSISSSPLAARHFDADRNTYSLSVIYDVHVAPAWSDTRRTFHGVASSYLASLGPGDKIHGYVRPTNVSFRLPSDPSTPVIMIASGTGLAPMRGFVEERVARAAAGRGSKMAPALLYFGCRDYEKDFICREELLAAEKDGAVSMRPTFSKRGPKAERERRRREEAHAAEADEAVSLSPTFAKGESVKNAGEEFKYAHERIWAEREECAKLFREGAKILLCGSASKLAKSTADTLKKIWLEHNDGKTEEDAEGWLQAQKEDRYVTDVFD